MRKVIIHSDGFGGDGTVILDDDGKKIENVYSVNLRIEANRVNEATLEVQMVQATAEATVEEWIFNCPMCGWSAEHKCDHSLGQDGASTQLSPVQPMQQVYQQSGQQIAVVAPPMSIAPSVCSKVMGSNICRVLMSVGAHSVHVDTATGCIWADQFRQLTNGTMYHV